MAILDFSVSGWHGFGSITEVCFGISVSNFMCMSLVAVGRSLPIFSYVAFKMTALWFWTMFNCNSPIAHCHPLLWGGGILVDHWSTISSLFLCLFIPLSVSPHPPSNWRFLHICMQIAYWIVLEFGRLTQYWTLQAQFTFGNIPLNPTISWPLIWLLNQCLHICRPNAYQIELRFIKGIHYGTLHSFLFNSGS